MKLSKETKELIRQAVGIIRPEIRAFARKLVGILPPQLRKEWIGRVIGFIAQRIAKTDLLGFQEAIANAVEIISDEIGKQVKEKSNRKEDIDFMNETKSTLVDIRERLRQASNIEDEKNRIIAEIRAYQDIVKFFKEIEEKFIPKSEKRIDWEKISEKIKNIENIIKEQNLKDIKEIVKNQKNEFLKGLKEGWQKGRKRGLI